jgi:hypothetical protein
MIFKTEPWKLEAQHGKKIAAIKLLREKRSLKLLQAKDIVEKYMSRPAIVEIINKNVIKAAVEDPQSISLTATYPIYSEKEKSQIFHDFAKAAMQSLIRQTPVDKHPFPKDISYAAYEMATQMMYAGGLWRF